MHYSANELLALRRLLGGLEPKNTALAVERSDGISIDSILAIQLRNWFLDLLDNGDARFLAPEDLAAEVTASAQGDATLITLPEGCHRAFSVRLHGWKRSARILPPDEYDAALRRQNNPYTAATPDSPVAVLTAGRGTDLRMAVCAWPQADPTAEAPVAELAAVVDRGENVFILDPSALSTLPHSDFLVNI